MITIVMKMWFLVLFLALVLFLPALAFVSGGFTGKTVVIGEYNAPVEGSHDALASSTQSGVYVGGLAPEFSVQLINGETFSLSDAKARGEWSVLYGFATWCPFCSKEIPLIQASYKKNEPAGVNLIGIDVDITESAQQIKTYQEEKGASAFEFAQGNRDILLDYQIQSTTTKIIINPQGIIEYIGSGVFSEENWDTIFAFAAQSP
ncbi:hypothetical protein COT72_03160 [archaeon CG10_big_fil_rev_8_21_14_0_10_43_11]|nr:MAG: hypothetical protein COT72_03160 [archaeon CG10_big_fil_rev_8_21_14_0_10_43_11]